MIGSTKRVRVAHADGANTALLDNVSTMHAIVKKLRREGVYGDNMASDVMGLVCKGYESGAIEEKMRRTYGD